MDTAFVGLMGFICTILGAAIGAATFWLSRKGAAKSDGREWGELQTNIKHIQSDVMDIKQSIKDNDLSLTDALAKERETRSESIRRLYNRLDDHLREYHNVAVPKNSAEELL